MDSNFAKRKPVIAYRLLNEGLLCALDGVSASEFSIRQLDETRCWVEQLIKLKPDLALIQTDSSTEQQYRSFLAEGLLTTCEFIFFSDGRFSPSLVEIMLKRNNFHFKAPFDLVYLNELLHDLFYDISMQQRTSDGPVQSKLDQYGLLAGSSAIMRRLYRVIHRAAATRSSVFLVGESGTGKELVANMIHMGSNRSNKKFVGLNCGALTPSLIESELFGHVKGAFTGASVARKGAFETADGGTLFLDELTEMPIEHQVKLLRVLETGEFQSLGSDEIKKVNVRIIAATNRAPAIAIRDGRLREDLYYRLCQFPINMPPLRSRGSDITGLTKHFLAYRNGEEGTVVEIGLDAIEKINQYHWPGNVRELRHAVERAYILADEIISAEHIIIESETSEDQESSYNLPTNMSLEELEKRVILKALKSNFGNKSETAEVLGISIKTLYNKLEKYNRLEESLTPENKADKERPFIFESVVERKKC